MEPSLLDVHSIQLIKRKKGRKRLKREREGERGKEKIIRKDRKELLMKRPAKVRSMWEKETEAVVSLKDPIDSLFSSSLYFYFCSKPLPVAQRYVRMKFPIS